MAQLLASCPGVDLVVTSRTPLRVRRRDGVLGAAARSRRCRRALPRASRRPATRLGAEHERASRRRRDLPPAGRAAARDRARRRTPARARPDVAARPTRPQARRRRRQRARSPRAPAHADGDDRVEPRPPRPAGPPAPRTTRGLRRGLDARRRGGGVRRRRRGRRARRPRAPRGAQPRRVGARLRGDRRMRMLETIREFAATKLAELPD